MSRLLLLAARALAQTLPCELPPGYQLVDCPATQSGILDCCNGAFNGPLGDPRGTQPVCAFYNDKYLPPDRLVWVMVTAFITTAAMAFGIGANDAANAWGTCVGSGAIPLFQAVILGGLMDWLGATTLGAGVSDTLKNGIADIKDPDCWACGYCDSEMPLFMLGMTCALLATAVFLLLASFTAMPVSTTHAIVGAIVGVTLVGTASRGCKVGQGLPQIVASWVISPLLSGAIGGGLYYVLHRFVIMAPDPEATALQACPWLYASSVFVMSCLIFIKSALTKDLALYWTALIAVGAAALTYCVVRFYLVREIARRIKSSAAEGSVRGAAPLGSLELATGQFSIDENDHLHQGSQQAPGIGLAPAYKAVAQTADELGTTSLKGDDGHRAPPLGRKATSNKGGAEGEPDDGDDDDIDLWSAVLPSGPPPASPRAIPGTFAGESYTIGQEHALFVFRYLLVFVAALESFAHGTNDTGNATGAFTAVWTTFRDGLDMCDTSETPVWIMFMGGFFVFLGTVLFGGRVIQTMGFGLTDINFLRGFCIEAASAASVVLATILGMPVSTTHCQVGAVIFVGWVSFGPRHVKWGMFGRIIITWIVTLPLSAALAAVLLLMLQGSIRS